VTVCVGQLQPTNVLQTVEQGVVRHTVLHAVQVLVWQPDKEVLLLSDKVPQSAVHTGSEGPKEKVVVGLSLSEE
jgi:hypothetical protein